MKKRFAMLLCLCMVLSCNYCIAENEEDLWLYQECMNAKTELLQWMTTRFYTSFTPVAARNTLILHLAATPQIIYRLEMNDSFRSMYLEEVGGEESDPKMQAKVESALPSIAISTPTNNAINQILSGSDTGIFRTMIENNQISAAQMVAFINNTQTSYLIDRPAFLTQPQLLWMEYANGLSLLVALIPNTDYGFVDVQIVLKPFSASSLETYFDLRPLSTTP